MEITIANKPATIERRDLIKAAEFYAKTLMNAQLVKNLKIDIEFNNLKGDHIEAQCNWEDRNVRPRWFTIQIDRNKSRRKILTLLAHEMVHVKQHATDESRNDLANSNLHIWQGKVVDEDKFDYYDLPWEIEAFGREQGLYTRFMIEQRAIHRAKAAKKTT